MTTTQQMEAALEMVLAIGYAIRALSEVPSGELYVRVMGHMSIQTYESIIGTLKRAKLVEECAHVLTWIGPKELS